MPAGAALILPLPSTVMLVPSTFTAPTAAVVANGNCATGTVPEVKLLAFKARQACAHAAEAARAHRRAAGDIGWCPWPACRSKSCRRVSSNL